MAKLSDTLFSPVFRRLLRDWVTPYRRLIALDLIFTLGLALSTSLYPLLVKWSIDRFEAGFYDELIFLPFALIAVTALKGGTLYMQSTLTNEIGSLILRDLQNAIFAALNRADALQIATEAPASLAQRFYVEMVYIQTAVARLLTSVIGDTLMILGLVCIMLYIDWKLALAGLAILPFAILPVIEVGKRLRANALAAQTMIGNMTSFLTEALAGARLIRTYQLEDYMNRRGTGFFEKIHQLRLRAANLFARVEPILEVLGGLSMAIVLMLVGWRIASGATSLGQFAGFIGALLLAAHPMRKLGNVNAVLQEGLAAAERVFALLDLKPAICDKPDAKPLPIGSGSIDFRDVSFDYGNAPALNGVSFTVPGGAKVALVGRSGAGKSTLFNLIPRLYEARSGQILIDGQDIKGVALSSLRKSIALVSQDVAIFQDTVRNNIALGKLEATAAQIEEAARAAAAHDFILKLPQGYDTMLGEGNIMLSGGERQRVALARALLRDAPILLLDEATSALDSESEHLVQQALARLSKGRTTLVIAHRLATVRTADLIVVMDAGRAVESGTHDELLRKKGAYAALYERQFHHGDGFIHDE